MYWFKKKTTHRASSVVVRKKKQPLRVSRRSLRSEADDAAQEVGHSARVWKTLYFFLWIAFGCVCFYSLFFSEKLMVRDIRIEGNDRLSNDSLRDAVQESISGKYFEVWPKNNLLLIRSGWLQDSLREDMKLIRSIDVQKVFPSTLSVSIQERKTVFVWCSGNGCWYVDEDGYAYDMANDLDHQSESWILRVTDMSGEAVDVSVPVVKSEFSHFAMAARDALSERCGIAIRPEVTTPSRLSDELRFATEEGWEAYIDTTLPIEKSCSMMKLLFAKEISSEDRKRLRYIDLRAENRIYYTFKDEESPREEDKNIEQEAREKKSDQKTTRQSQGSRD